MSKRSPGSKYAIKEGRKRYLVEKANAKANRLKRAPDWSCSGCSALLPDADLGHEQAGERFCDICHGEAQR